MKYVIYVTLSLPLGFFLGNILVYIFNRIPAKWLCDYNEEPGEELLNTEVRMRSVPYKYIFSALFSCCLIYLSVRYGGEYAIVSSFALFVMYLAALCDWKYMIVPDELVILLTASTIGFLPMKLRIFRELLFGFLAGVIIALALFALGKLLFRKPGIGGADIKLYSAIGLMTGVRGVISVFLITTVLSGLGFFLSTVVKKGSFKDQKPLVPYMAAALTIYLVFLFNITEFKIFI